MSIREYFADKEVLVTGVTGLVGKALLEKVLRDLPEVRHVHVLIRPKTTRRGRTTSPEQRFQREVLASSAFDRLREIHGDSFDALVGEKVSVVAGDLAEDDLGMDAATREQLQGSVRAIINCAAVVSFDAPIGSALELNTLGPLRVLEFARGCVDPLFAHVSTCYVNGIREGAAAESPLDPKQDLMDGAGATDDAYDVDDEVEAISELVLDTRRRARLPWRRMAFALEAKRGSNNGRRSGSGDASEATDSLSEEWVQGRLVAEGLRRARRRGWNDVYTFTKAMGEQLLVRNCGDIPTLIFRPSIIESALQEPEPGWLEGFRMIDPLIVAYGRGHLPDFPGDPDSIVDLVPVDKVVNALLASIPTAEGRAGLTVYQLATGGENRLTFRDFCGLVRDHLEQEPLSGRGAAPVVLPPITFQSTERFLQGLHPRGILPLWALLDALTLIGSVTPWVRRYRATLRSRRSSLERLANWAQIYSPYSNAHRRYECDRMWQVLDGLAEDERERFDFEVRAVDWKNYIQDVHIPGIKRFLLGFASRARPSADRTGRRQSIITDVPGDKDIRRHLGAQWLWDPVRGATRWLWSLGYRYYLGFQYEGLERVPASGPFIVVANHSSHLDTSALLIILTKRNRCLHPVAAKDYWFRNRLASWASRVFIDAIPFDRQAHFAQSLGLSIALLRKNHSLLYFPEGGRSTTGEMRAFKSGLGVLALESGAPIVPANISGSFEALAKGKWIPKRHRILVRFGAPISMEPYLQVRGAEDATELARKITEDAQTAVEALC